MPHAQPQPHPGDAPRDDVPHDDDPRIRERDVTAALTGADLPLIPDGAPRGTHGIKAAQMKDAVLVVCSAPGEAATLALRDRARRALRAAGFLVKDSPQAAALLYVIDRM